MRDQNSADDIINVFWLTHGAQTWIGSCGLWYHQPSNQLHIVSDNGAVWSSPITPGSGTLSNSRCSVDGAHFSVQQAGDELRISARVIYAGGPRATLTHWVRSQDSLTDTGWSQEGLWTLPGAPNGWPSIGAVTPSEGQGLGQTFEFEFHDPNGGDDVSFITLILNESLAWANGCNVRYFHSTGEVSLVNDEGSAYLGPVAIGPGASLSNSTCTVDISAVSATVAGETLTVHLPIAFAPGSRTFNGYLAAYDDSGYSSGGWEQRGSWSLPTKALDAEILSVQAPSSIAPGLSFPITVSVRNTGENSWESVAIDPANPVRLGVPYSAWYPGRVNLPQSLVNSGEAITFDYLTLAPSMTGPAARSKARRPPQATSLSGRRHVLLQAKPRRLDMRR